MVETVHGAFSIAEYRNLITSLLPTKTDELIASALQKFGAGERELALSELAKEILVEPDNAKLAMYLGRLLLIDEQHDVSYEVLKNLPDEVQSEAEVNALIVHIELNQAAKNISSMEQITNSIEKDPDDCLPLLQYAAISLFNDDYETSMDYFLSILKKDREFQNDIGRRGMLSIFHTLGKEQSNIVDKYRSMMFNELH